MAFRNEEERVKCRTCI